MLAGIDQEMYEAAYLDGANARQKMWYITIPMLIPMVVIMTLLGLGGIMTWQDAVEFMLAGASAVAVGAHNFVDPRAVETIAEGLDQYCKDEGIEHIQDIVGALEIRS